MALLKTPKAHGRRLVTKANEIAAGMAGAMKSYPEDAHLYAEHAARMKQIAQKAESMLDDFTPEQVSKILCWQQTLSVIESNYQILIEDGFYRNKQRHDNMTMSAVRVLNELVMLTPSPNPVFGVPDGMIPRWTDAFII